MPPPQYHNRPNERTKNPRRVRGGVKMPSTERASESWAGQRWLRLVESGVATELQAEAMEYAALGQTRTIGFERGAIVAAVQGRAPRAYRVRVELDAFDEAQWDRVLASMSDQARYAAKLLAGELPTNIEELFVPLGLHLYPQQAGELRPSCTCDEAKADPGQWCKHSACAALITADHLAVNPWLVFTLRGMDKNELLERLRQARLLPVSADGSAPVYTPHVAALEAMAVPPLEETLGHFWDQPASLEHLHLTVERPAVSHPLLRRLGQSPFEQSRFPLVGLLATCYDLASERVLAQERAREEADADDHTDSSGDDSPEAGLD
ncbi:MAG: SWIM zinc finger family protein [Phycisphaerales bacterium]